MDDNQTFQDNNPASSGFAQRTAPTSAAQPSPSPVSYPSVTPYSSPAVVPTAPSYSSSPMAGDVITPATPVVNIPPVSQPPVVPSEEPSRPAIFDEPDEIETTPIETLGPTRFSFDDDAPTTDDAIVPPLTSDQPEEAKEELPPEEPSAPAISISDVSPLDEDDLASMKREALSELTPLVDRLDLAPEKRYDIIMEIIQASANGDLLKPAYEAARQISDPDLKAKALLEVVNEIDYLSKPKD